jgi:hypothetical protein
MEIAVPAAARDARDAVVLVSGADGGELEVVYEALSRWQCTPTVLLTRADLASVPLSFDLDSGLLEVGDRLIRPAVVWLRHATAGAIAAQARPAGSVSLLGATAWSVLLAQLAASARAVLPGSAPCGAGQLADAARLGVRVPRTVLGTDAATARQRVGAGRAVVKEPDFRLFEPDSRTWAGCLPQLIDDAAGLAGPAIRADRGGAPRPVVVQEYVAHVRELRVYYLNGGICAFQVDKPDLSALWVRPGTITVSRTDCPPAAAEAVRTLCAAWGLRFGAFDLLMLAAGEPVLLEVNPDGDWLWYERRSRWHGVSFMATAMVRELFVRITSMPQGEGEG